MAVAAFAGLIPVLEFIYFNIDGLTGKGTTAKRSDVLSKYSDIPTIQVAWDKSPALAARNYPTSNCSQCPATLAIILGQVNHLSAIILGVGVPLLGIMTATCAVESRAAANTMAITDLVDPFVELGKSVDDMASTILASIACASGADAIYNYTLAASLSVLNDNMAAVSAVLAEDISDEEKSGKIMTAYGGMNATFSALGQSLTVSLSL